MTRTRPVVLLCVMVVAGGAVLLVARSAWLRSQQPQYEGRTAEEWLDYLERRTTLPQAYVLPDKEVEVVFRSLGPGVQKDLLRIYLTGKWPPRNHTNLYAFGEKLPPSLRFRFLRDPAVRSAIMEQAIQMTRPPWKAFAPYVPTAMTGGDSNRVNATLNVLGYVGDGAGNALPWLLSGLTNSQPLPRRIALQSLGNLGTNAAPALPYLLAALSPNAWDQRSLQILGNLGPIAHEAVPALEQLLGKATSPRMVGELGVTILRIDPENELALHRMETLFTSTDPADRDATERLRLSFEHPSPNPAIARLIRLKMQNATDPQGPLFSLFQHDPESATAIARTLLAQGKNPYAYLSLLLSHDPNDPVALGMISNRIYRPSYPHDTGRNVWLYSLSRCYPDSPGVQKMLDHAEAGEHDRLVKQTLEGVRREIELNGELRRLRATSEGRLP